MKGSGFQVFRFWARGRQRGRHSSHSMYAGLIVGTSHAFGLEVADPFFLARRTQLGLEALPVFDIQV